MVPWTKSPAWSIVYEHTDRPVGKVVRAVKSATHKAQNLFTGDSDTPPIVEDLVNKLEQEERRRGETPSDSG